MTTTSHTRSAQPVPDVLLEQFALGELDAAAADTVEQQLAESPALRGRLAAIERSNAEIRTAYPPDALARDVVIRAGGGPPPRRRGVLALAAATAALVIGTSWMLTKPNPAGSALEAPGRTDAGDDRIKGTGAALAVYRKTAAGSEPLRDGDAARAGDVLRVGYQAARDGYGAIVSADGRGGVTLHYPANGSTAAPLQAGGLVLLNDAFELDDAPRWERFHLFSSATPFDLDPVLRAVRADDASAVAPVLEHSTLSLVKEPTP